MSIGFDLGHDLDLDFPRSNMEFAISQPKMVRLPQNEKQTYRLNSRPQIRPWPWKVRCKYRPISYQGDLTCRRAVESFVVPCVIKTRACHHTLYANHWHCLWEILLMTGNKNGITTLNVLRTFMVDMFFRSGGIIFTAIKNTNIKGAR